MASRRAFTLVELLVVIAIIGVLVALLLPAVQQSREASRRTQCSNQLKQIVLGLQNYHDQHGRFCAGYYQGPNPNSQNESTWITHVLPFLEHGNLVEALPTWNVCFGCQPNGALVVVGQPLKAFHCPSNLLTGLALQYYAKGSYAGNNGLGPMATESWNTTSRGPYGTFRQNVSLRMADIVDGTSQTVAVSELVNERDDFRGVMHYPEGPLYQHNYGPNALAPDQFRGTLCISTRRAPCLGTYSIWDMRSVVLSARSWHRGGVQAGLVDGSVRWFSDSIQLSTWQNLGIPDDGNVLGDF